MTGWQCPGCGRYYSPMVESCRACVPAERPKSSLPILKGFVGRPYTDDYTVGDAIQSVLDSLDARPVVKPILNGENGPDTVGDTSCTYCGGVHGNIAPCPHCHQATDWGKKHVCQAIKTY